MREKILRRLLVMSPLLVWLKNKKDYSKAARSKKQVVTRLCLANICGLSVFFKYAELTWAVEVTKQQIVMDVGKVKQLSACAWLALEAPLLMGQVKCRGEILSGHLKKAPTFRSASEFGFWGVQNKKKRKQSAYKDFCQTPEVVFFWFNSSSPSSAHLAERWRSGLFAFLSAPKQDHQRFTSRAGVRTGRFLVHLSLERGHPWATRQSGANPTKEREFSTIGCFHSRFLKSNSVYTFERWDCASSDISSSSLEIP